MRHRKVIGSLSLVCLLLLAGLLAGQPGGRLQPDDGSPLRRILPARADLIPPPDGPAGDPWKLFDGDTERGFASPDGRPAHIRLRLDRARTLAALGVFGPAEGFLRVSIRRGPEWVPIQELDLRNLRSGWHRVSLAEPVAARALLVEWQPLSAGASLPEIELWAEGSEDGRHAVPAAPLASGESFQLVLDEDPAAFSRAFLTYELAGISHWTGALRSINGLPAQGGFAPAVSAGATLQSEEINPRWLRRGLNEVRFLPLTGEDGEPLPWSVANLQVVLVEDGGRPLVRDAGASPAPSSLAAALLDGRIGTGWNGGDDPAGSLRGAVDLPFRAASQPYELELTVTGRPAGVLTVEALLRDGTAVPAAEPVDLGALGPGSHRLSLDSPAAAGLRLTWNGADERGEIAEVDLLAGAAGRQPRLQLTYPLAGEEADGGAYLRGFLDPAGRLLVDGAEVPGALKPDGAFGLFVPRTADGPWEVTLDALFPGGARLRKVVRLGQVPKDENDPESLREEQAAPGVPRTLSLAGASLQVPPGALAQKTALSMRRLAAGDLPGLDAGMTNVTAGRGGFRMGPHGIRFREPVFLTLPFDRALIPAGLSEDDVQVFYFDEATGRWLPVPRAELKAGAVVGATDHFTDFIAATLAMPDEPEGESFEPNSLDELETADPAAEITLIEPPQAGPTGNADLSFPLTLPPGRQGLEPDLEVTYSSGAQNGWLGMGWDLALPAVEISTLFGVPRYDPIRETETYLLDGEQLAPVSDPAAPRTAERAFTRRVEGSFERIVRHGSGPAGFWWEVTDQDGVRRLYGRSPAARLGDPRTGNTFRWHLEQVIDLHGNRIDFTYTRDSGTDGEPWVQLYPERIDYTGSPRGGALYQVRFVLDDGAKRPDRLSTGMPGFKVATRRRLQRVDVLAGGAPVRSYAFAYRAGGLDEAFYKSLLESIAVLGPDGTEHYRHTFEYFRRERQGDAWEGFGQPEAWNGLRSSRDETDTLTWAVGAHAFAGLGPPECQPHGGIQLGGGGGETTMRSSFVDVDGDGLPDRIDEDGNVDRNGYDPMSDQGAFSRTSFDGAGPLGHSIDWNIDFGAGVHAEAGITAALDASWAWVHSSDDQAVADVNGDGRPDLVSSADGFGVRVNTGSGFSERSDWSGFGNVDLAAPGEEEEVLAAFRPADALRKLKLPRSGRVSVGGAVQRKQTGGDGVRAEIFHNGSRAWRRTVEPADTSACVPAPGDACGGGLELDVQAGDELYFLAASGRDTSADDLLWAPRVAYLGEDAEAREPYGARVHVFDAGEDFRLAGFAGAGWAAPFAGTVRVTGGLVKQTTSDDVTVRVRTNQSTVYSRTLGAGETGSFDEVPAIPVQAGEALYFELSSETPVDPERAAWTPTVTYEGGELCKPLPDGTIHCGTLSCGTDDCTLSGDPLPIRRDLAVQPAQVSHSIPRLLPRSEATRSWTAPAAGTYSLAVSWSRDDAPEGTVRIYAQGLHKLFAKRLVPGRSDSFSLDLDLAAGEPVFVGVLADRSGELGALTASIDGDALPVNLRYRDPDPRGDVLSGGWHGWYLGEWNGKLAFQPGRLVPPDDESDGEPDYLPAVPRWQGTEGFRAPVWVAAGFDLHLAAEGVKPSRRGGNVAAQLDRGSGGGGGLSVLRQTAGRTASVSVAAGLGLSLSAGTTDAQLDLLDVNGDGYADQVSGDGVRFSNGRDGFGPLEEIPNLGGAVREVSDATVGTTVGLGVNFVKKNGRGQSQAVLNTLPSVGSTISLAQTETDLLDVNGDGLPDRIEMAPGSSSARVRLNLGYRFGDPEAWDLPGWDGAGSSRCQDVVDYVASEVAGALSALDTLDALSFTRSSAAHAGVAIGPFGGGVVTTLARTLVELADVNGDGLLDRVAKEHGDPWFRVQLNRGDGWGPEERWNAPDWSLQPGSGYNPGLFECLDSVAFQGHIDGNASVGAPICIPLIPPEPVVGLQIELSAQASGGEGGLQLSLQDLDGDGLTDHVLKRSGDSNVYVRRNQARKVNLLSAVHRPLGGTIRLDYRRQGNRVDLSDPAHRIDLPHGIWALASATVDDGRGNAYLTRFDYFNDGFYDRAERESYGFARVLTTLPDGATIDRRYHNQDFHRRYLLTREAVADASGRLFRADTAQYELADVAPGSRFPALVREETAFYEGTGAPQKTTARDYEHDGLGNVVAFRDHADEGSEDDAVAAVAYHVDPATGVVKPRAMEVRDGLGRLLRRKDAVYDAYGDLVRLEQTLTGGKAPESGAPYSGDTAVWSWAYDELGNLASSVDPVGYTRSFTYDAQALTHPIEVRDSFGYVTRQAWDLRFGEPAETIDPAGASIRQVWDAFGRLAEVYGPYDSAGAPALRFDYNPSELPARAVVHHKDATRSDPIDTAVFVDGLGRTIQSKEDTEIDAGSGTSTRVGVRVSGRVVFDARGRLAAEGQPAFDTQAIDRFVDVPLANATAFEHDVLDRVRRVRFPHGAETRLDHGFAELDGVVRLASTRTDPNGRATRFFYDVQGELLGIEQTNRGRKLVTRYAYDALSQLLAATDAKGNVTRQEWDTLGRNVVLDSPDSGRVEMRYDRAGNLGAKVTPNLAARGQQIRYLRTFHRLDRVDYPAMPDVVFTYGEPGAPFFRAGRVATVTDESGVEERFYGRLGEMARRTKQAVSQNGGSPRGPFTTTFEHDGFGRLLSMTYPDGEAVTYGFDAEGRVKSAAGLARGVRTDYLVHLGYDEFGDRARAVYGNGVETRWSYDPQSRHLKRLTTLERGGREIQDLALTLDPAGTLLGLVNEVPMPAASQIGGPTSQSFRYDDLYQLTGSDGTWQSAPNKRATYSLALAYDDLGNITSKKQLHQVVTGGKANVEKKTTYDWAYLYGGPRPHAPTHIGDRGFEYDADGNQTGWQQDVGGTRRALAWDEEDQLKSVSDNGQTTRFLYDAHGVRTSKAGPNGETVYVDAWYSLRNGAIGSRHVWVDGLRVATRVVPNAEDPGSWKLYFYQADHLGSTQYVTDERGLAWQHLEYFPSGETWVDERTETQRTPWQFAGKEMDEETGLSYFGFRYYDARQSQWINPDPILDELLDTGRLARSDLSDDAFYSPGQIYGYAGNDPANLIDPDGLAKSKRSQFVGSTPSKNSGVGKTVRQRMAKQGKLKGFGKKGETVHVYDSKVKKRVWKKVDRSIHMGHLVDAARGWNAIGRFFGARHKVIRAFMNDPENYELEDGHTNMQKGAKMGATIRYLDPSPTLFDKVKGNSKKLAAWLKLFRAARKKYLTTKEWNQLKKHVPAIAH
ncbi:MAG: toxin TcdB middle/N-terminal domain-containing protein [Thermoanaerobaculia bacterium]